MIEKILEETKEVKANGNIYKIKKLSLLQLIKLTKFLFSLATKIPLNFKDSKDNLSDLLTILNAVDEEQTIDLYSILLNEGNKEKIKEDIVSDAVISSEILRIICEINDFGKIFGNFQKTAELMKNLSKTKTESLPSSVK